MGTHNFVWSLTKKAFTFGLIAFTVSDRYGSVIGVQGTSMSPTINPGSNTYEYVLVEKFCLEKYKFSRGDVVVFRYLWVWLREGLPTFSGLPKDSAKWRQEYLKADSPS